jgi:hypothetical protein
MDSFLVGSESISGSGKRKFWILSQKKQAGMARDPKTGLLRPEAASEFNELIRYFKSKKSGHIDMPYQRVESF